MRTLQGEETHITVWTMLQAKEFSQGLDEQVLKTAGCVNSFTNGVCLTLGRTLRQAPPY
ncbi:uncharacterized protein PHALS_06562 [Plasmopara halstedii]|uniref:Uncharacterized protein n=1 Tax=Plasmopara halstedii TaxID=4781 RepID=A0A0P1B2S0_PLAHL|nr:uncharacterized protein PHALS_06562 [Plasmopara halstedii]CEG48757.1 hypothetical protein PHALS_06562 [Plasmopara halstedii]|eukprot:XP_024585126.1 hypothetical protein PHALS_06562 [Plasmopara halstedii]